MNLSSRAKPGTLIIRTARPVIPSRQARDPHHPEPGLRVGSPIEGDSHEAEEADRSNARPVRLRNLDPTRA
jgi:hypothetical protein